MYQWAVYSEKNYKLIRIVRFHQSSLASVSFYEMVLGNNCMM